MVDDQQLKISKIEGNDGKKRKYHQSRSNQVADPKQSFETAVVKPNKEKKNTKKAMP